jgi:hypothetical protein
MAKLCDGGVRLRRMVDEKFPGRDKRSDGWIGDSAHSKRKSDHNPNAKGIVRAIDLDENMGKRGKWRNGRQAKKLADQLIAYAATDLSGSKRIKYVVYEGKLASGTYRSTWWRWRGSSYGHYQHIHVSFTAKADSDGKVFPLPCLAKTYKQKRRWTKQLKAAKN